MRTKPILESEYASLRISALPSRPTASSAFGGRGYTASQLKEAFDQLPMLLVARFNALLEDIERTGEDSLAQSIPTGLENNHTLSQLFNDVQSGTLATYLQVGDQSLFDQLTAMKSKLDSLSGGSGDSPGATSDALDGGHPSERVEE